MAADSPPAVTGIFTLLKLCTTDSGLLWKGILPASSFRVCYHVVESARHGGLTNSGTSSSSLSLGSSGHFRLFHHGRYRDRFKCRGEDGVHLADFGSARLVRLFSSTTQLMLCLAFTIPLPLFPRLIAWYLHKESHSTDTLLSRLLSLSHAWRSSLLSISGPNNPVAGEVGRETRWLWSGGREGAGTKNWDVVLLGGAMGSLFSLCQCIISPWLGRRE